MVSSWCLAIIKNLPPKKNRISPLTNPPPNTAGPGEVQHPSITQPLQEGGFGYSPALLTLASLYETGYEPAIQQDAGQAARCLEKN